jgi:glycosyltransferase involved in cell wall biosynthesis
MTPDITVVLNVHDDAKYLRRTLLSLQECAAYASQFGVATELLVVIDRGSRGTRNWLKDYSSQSFASVAMIKVDNGDLALSRNDGMAHATGEFLMTADADDLVSFNTIADAVKSFRENDLRKSVIVPNYVYSFGDDFYLRVCMPLGVTNLLSFFDFHPYSSRFIGRTTELRNFNFVPHRAKDGLAFEDWHFNCELLAAGFDFVVGKDTILFYRRSSERLNAASTAATVGIIARSRFHDPQVFIAIGEHAERDHVENRFKVPPNRLQLEPFVKSHTCHELLCAAARIEPGINLAALNKIAIRGGARRSIGSALHYLHLCRKLNTKRFRHVVLLPFMVNAGAEKYILTVLNELIRIEPESRILFISGQKWDRHEGLDRLSPGSDFIDIHDIGSDLDEQQRQILVLRLIQVFAPSAVVHLKSCKFVREFMRAFGKLLDSQKFVFYRFCENLTQEKSTWVSSGRDFNFLSDTGEQLDLIVTDNLGQARHDLLRLDFLAGKVQPIYACHDASVATADPGRPFTRKLLWASRFDLQKRPGMLVAIAKVLVKLEPDIEIHVYGSSILDRNADDLFEGCPNVIAKGSFSKFEDLPLADFDALLYTSAFDGLPNIILECMAAGISVIAPDVGGISEVVTPDTGYLVANDTDDAILVKEYIAAVRVMYGSANDAARVRQGALDMLRAQHSVAVFRDRVKSCYGPLLQEVSH